MDIEKHVDDDFSALTAPGYSRHIAYFDQAEGAVPNPGMGTCCYVYSDHMVVAGSDWQKYSAPRPVDRATFDRMMALEHCDNVYIRPEWRDIQQEPGKLHLPDYWQWTVEACRRLGKRWSFRIQQAMPQSIFAHSVPEFLISKLNFIPYRNYDAWGPATKYFPAYDDQYLGYWSEMLHLLGERFDHDPHLEFADISGYGKWGEWHHCPEKGIESEAHGSVARRLIDDHLSAFPKTPAIMMLHPFDPEAQYKREALDYALGRGCGLRRDSFCPLFTQWELWQVSHARQPGTMFVYEPGYYPDNQVSLPGSPPRVVDYEKIYQPLLDIGSSYLSLGFNPWQAIITHEHHPDLLKRISRRVGYRIRPAVVWAVQAGPGKSSIALGLMNDGVATPSGTLKVTAAFDAGPSLELELPSGAPCPGPMQLFRLMLPEDFARFGNTNVLLTLSIRMARKTHPVRWAVKEGAAADPGGYVLKIPIPEDIG